MTSFGQRDIDLICSASAAQGPPKMWRGDPGRRVPGQGGGRKDTVCAIAREGSQTLSRLTSFGR